MLIKDIGTRVPKVWGEETWFFSDREEVLFKVRVNNETVPFSEVIGDFLKTRRYSRFPVLVKILKTREPTSVQVHPSDEEAKRLGEQDAGKEEVWTVLSDTGKILLGTKKPQENPCEMLEEFSLKRLDVINIPSGTVHSIMENTTVLEVSTNSNITYRIYDWGRDRELHIEKAKEVIKTRKASELLFPPLDKKPFENSFFKLEYLKNKSTDINGNPWIIVVCITGKGYLNNVSLQQEEAALILSEETSLNCDSGEYILISPGERIK